jgi:aspartokinase
LRSNPLSLCPPWAKRQTGCWSAEHAARGDLYVGSKCLDELQDYHFEVAGQVANGEALHRLETSLQRSFRDLRVIQSEVVDEGREVTPALLDEIASFGERISSEAVAAALESAGVPSVHLDARQVILTDSRHTQATPLYWESYAKLRRGVPYLSDGRVGGHGWLYRLHGKRFKNHPGLLWFVLDGLHCRRGHFRR